MYVLTQRDPIPPLVRASNPSKRSSRIAPATTQSSKAIDMPVAIANISTISLHVACRLYSPNGRRCISALTFHCGVGNSSAAPGVRRPAERVGRVADDDAVGRCRKTAGGTTSRPPAGRTLRGCGSGPRRAEGVEGGAGAEPRGPRAATPLRARRRLFGYSFCQVQICIQEVFFRR